MGKYPIYWPQFFTATILEWKHLLRQEKYKMVIVDTLRHLTINKKITLYAFVIMDNHLHIIWQSLPGSTPVSIQAGFMKFTARQIKLDLIEHHPLVLEKFKVNAKDREYQFWERNALGIDLYSHEVFMQKLEYIHWNPVKAGLCNLPEEYYYSSAKYYHTGIDDFGILTHC
jgi:REP element-mobilizing transposase RayT